MAQMLAPYHNAMRLGQGFNSYTQQICLDQAVLEDTQDNRSLEAGRVAASKGSTQIGGGNPASGLLGVASHDGSTDSGASDHPAITRGDEVDNILGDAHDPLQPKRIQKSIQVPGWVKPQIVTYSSRFVDKLSDVTDAMNISGSLSIKTATIGGKANGSYVDSDKFQSSDIKFHLQVKVTNQIHHPPKYSIFNKIDNLPDTSYPEVYGDSFISGWEEGGELNAIISVKVRDKSKIFQIKVGIEAELTQPTVAGKISGDVNIEKAKSSKETETTITVNWSGGGSIKDPTEDWTIASLKKAAAAFPELVAITPQRTYAILTKYTALESFHRQANRFSLLDYENAGIYTNSLLDRYMEYKSLWKQISVATLELENNRADIALSEPGEDMYKLAKVKKLPHNQTNIKAIIARREQQQQAEQKEGIDKKPAGSDNTQDLRSLQLGGRGNSDDAGTKEYKVFPASFAGLIEARQVCRAEMVKIVNEVDIVSKAPNVAADISRDEYFLNPIVFKQLLPVVRSKTAEDAVQEVKNPSAPLILGYISPPTEAASRVPVYVFDDNIKDHSLRLQQSVQKLAYKSRSYRLRGCAGAIGKVHSQAAFFNDLERLDATYRPIQISAWTTDGRLDGFELLCSNEETFSHGVCEGAATHILSLNHDGSEIISEVSITQGETESGFVSITALMVSTSACNTLDTTAEPNPAEVPPAPQPAVTSDANTNPEAAASSDAPQATATSGAGAASQPTTTTGAGAASHPTTTSGAGVASPAAAASNAGTAPQTTNAPAKATEPPSETTPAPKPIIEPLKNVRTHTWSRLDDGQWSLRGFFGFTHLDQVSKKNKIISLGVVWGKDEFVPVPNARIIPPLSKQFLSLSPALRENVKQISGTTTFEGRFIMGESVLASNVSATPPQTFNALDGIDSGWNITEVAFACQNGKLSGLQVRYQTGDVLSHGNFTEETKAWSCKVKADLIKVKITAGKVKEADPGYIDTVEFIRAEPDGQLPAWPLNLSTVRFLGETDTRVSRDVQEMIESAPILGSRPWSVKGFYGEHSEGLITRLGVVWGRSA